VVNLGLKLALYQRMGPAGLALATATGAWINFALLIALGMRRRSFAPDKRLIENVAIAALAAGAASFAAPFCFYGVDHYFGRLPLLRNELDIAAAGLLAFAVYAIVYVLGALAFGRSARKQLL
jgi:putative peptidoglycan lipid II flippase